MRLSTKVIIFIPEDDIKQFLTSTKKLDLTRLIDFLDQIEHKKFCMQLWKAL